MNIPEFKTVPRAIAVDLDGTLLNSRTELSERNRSALERCIGRGIPVIIATSRPARIFNRIFPQELRQRCSYILMNGALAVGNPPLTGYFKETLPEEVILAIIACALEYDPKLRITIEIDGYEFGTNGQWDPASLWQRNAATPEMVLSIEEAIRRKPCKIALGNTDIFLLAEILERKCGDTISVVGAKFSDARSNPLLNITAKTATKAQALGRLLAPLGISVSQVIAFGDDLPDLEMLQACGTSVAMANAFPEVKAACKYETAGNDEDGVAVVLEQIPELLER